MRSSQSHEGEQVARYFDQNARDFDTIYETEKRPLRRWRDRLTRGTVVQRLDLVDDIATRHASTRILDVGCGPARFAVRLAPRASAFVGIDFAPEMIALARQKAVDAGVGEKCSFHAVDFLTWDPGQEFDLALAIGVVDYISDPGPLLAKMAEASGGNIIVSFPRLMQALTPLRFVRLRASGCPVFFYTRRQVDTFGRTYLRKFRVERLGRDYILVGNL